MFFTIYLCHDDANGYRAMVPDLPACEVVSESKARALTDIHLMIETHVAALLGHGKEIPLSRSVEQFPRDGEYSAGELFAVHINLDHLRAVAVHQSGRWE
jgi:predicted RNase H-like HicB family nuclease